MMSIQSNPTEEMQLISVNDETTLTKNEWTTVFEEDLVEVFYVVFYQSNSEADVKDIEIKTTIDGVEYEGSVSGVSGGGYLVSRSLTEDSLLVSGTVRNFGYYASVKCMSLKIEIRITSDLGTNQHVYCIIQRENAPSDSYWWYKHYPTEILTETSPEIDTYYSMLAEVEDCRLLFSSIRQINDNLDDENLKGKITIDGNNITQSAVNVNNTWYYNYLSAVSDLWISNNSTIRNCAYYDALEGQSIEIEVQQTTDIGNGAQIDGRVVYELYEEVT